MPETYGPTELPAAVPSLETDEAAGDPVLTVLGAFLAAVINADCGAAWRAIYPTDDPVRSVRFTNPNEISEFVERDLPALFVYRQSQQLQRIADTWFEDQSAIVAVWVPPPGTMRRLTERQPFANNVVKAVHRALARGSHPAWVADGDTSPGVDTFGSDLIATARLSKDLLGFRVEKVPITVESVDGSAPKRYPGVQAVIETHELLEQSPNYPEAYPPWMRATLTNLSGATVRTMTGSDPLLDGGFASSTETDYAGASFDAGPP